MWLKFYTTGSEKSLAVSIREFEPPEYGSLDRSVCPTLVNVNANGVPCVVSEGSKFIEFIVLNVFWS